MSEELRRLAERVQGDPMFLAFYLAQHRRAMGLTWDEQAALLSVTPDALVMIALCRSPRLGKAAHNSLRADTIIG